jgi:hypothetical protein
MVEVTIGNILNTYMDECDDTEDTDLGSGPRIAPSEVSLRLYFITSSQQIRKDVLTSLSTSSAIRSDARSMLLDVIPRRRISDLDSLSLLSPETSTVHVSIPTFSSKFAQRFAAYWDFVIKGARDVCFALPPIPAERNGEKILKRSVNEKVQIHGIQGLKSGYFEGHGQFLLSEEVGSSAIKYNTLEVVCGKSWSLCARKAGSDEEILIQGPISMLSHCVSVSACKLKKTVTIFLILKCTPNVLYRESKEKATKKRIFLPVLDKSSEVFRTEDSRRNWRGKGEEKRSVIEIAEDHLALIVGRPVLAVVFPLDTWNDISSVFSDTMTVGLPALVIRSIEIAYPASNAYQPGVSLLIEGESAPLLMNT